MDKDNQRTLKVLAIGNSFSEDATYHLYDIAAACGAQDIKIGNLYIGGCSLATHWENAKGNIPAYRYDKNTDGTWRYAEDRTLLEGLQDEAWDIITLQQVSHFSGLRATYTEDDVLTNLIDYVNTHRTNPDAQLAWHMTWAYQADSTHEFFHLYDHDQTTMYNEIVTTVKEEIRGNQAFATIIPTGTAIQNVRTSPVGDTLTRDGFHLSWNLGRYIAALTYLVALTGWSIDELTYVPDDREIPPEYLPIIKEAVAAAVENPFQVTQSSYR